MPTVTIIAQVPTGLIHLKHLLILHVDHTAQIMKSTAVFNATYVAYLQPNLVNHECYHFGYNEMGEPMLLCSDNGVYLALCALSNSKQMWNQKG